MFDIAIADTRSGKMTFGEPLDVNNYARLSFWPQHKGQWPLLYAAVSDVLIAPYTSMKCERVNSAAGIITSRLRACMTPAMLERFVLGQQWLKEILASGGLQAPTSGTDDILDWADSVTVAADEADSERDLDAEPVEAPAVGGAGAGAAAFDP